MAHLSSFDKQKP